jgi:hypothetical protein
MLGAKQKSKIKAVTSACDPASDLNQIGQCALLDDIYKSEIGCTNARRLFKLEND